MPGTNDLESLLDISFDEKDKSRHSLCCMEFASTGTVRINRNKREFNGGIILVLQMLNCCNPQILTTNILKCNEVCNCDASVFFIFTAQFHFIRSLSSLASGGSD